MNKQPTFYLIYKPLFYILIFIGILPQNLNAQSIYMSKLNAFPLDPSQIKEVEAPKGISRWIILRDDIGDRTIRTDTFSITTYDAQGRTMEYIGFSDGKQDSHYYSEYPNAKTRKFYDITKVNNKLSIRNYNEITTDKAGNFIDASSYEITNMGDSTMRNDHDYLYDDKLRLIYQCDVCNNSFHVNRYFFYEGYKLIRLLETYIDTIKAFNTSNITYDKDDRMTHYTYQAIAKGDTTLLHDRIYTYEDGRMVKQMTYNLFDSTWREFVYRYDSLGRISQYYQIISTDTTTTTYYFEGDKLKRTFLTTTFLYADGHVLFGTNFHKKPGEKDHTTETRYTYDNKGNCIITEYYWDGKLRKRIRNVFE